MKYKLLILITLILLLGISTVWAENETGTFSDVQNALNTNSEIVYLNNSNYIGEGNEITINRDIILDGGDETGTGSSTLNANGASRIIKITNNSTVVLRNINFINGNTSENGGALLFNSNYNLIICNCNFTNNSANIGGALYSQGGLNVYDANFINNSCKLSANGIYSENDYYYILNSHFESDLTSNYEIIINNQTISTEENITKVGANNFGFLGSSDYQLLMYNPQYNGTFPSRYNLRDYGHASPVLDQGNSGTCWAQASMAVLISCILKATNGENVFKDCDRLSVANMVNNLMDHYYKSLTYASGGYFEYCLAYFTSWMGPTLETNDPWYEHYNPSEIYNSVVHVQNAYNLPARANYTDLNTIKRAIMDYGSLYAPIYMGGTQNEFHDMYEPKSITINHAVAIIGWDDTYSRYNFKPVNGQYPEGDGAFIAQNSWGEGWGRNGLFYVSYYDNTILKSGERAWTIIFNDTLRYDKNYQKDIKGKSSHMIYGSSAYTFTEYTAAEDDYLVAISNYFADAYDYKFQIFVNGESVLNQSGTQDKPGYYTFEFDKFIPIKAGDVFRIELTYYGLNGESAKVYLDSDYQSMIKAYTSHHLFESVQNRIDYAKPNSEIFLNNKTYFASFGEKTIIVNKNITINGAKSNGEGFSTLDGQNLFSILKIMPGCSVVLKNINFINSLNSAILVDVGAVAKIMNCNFTNNRINSITINGNGTLENCIFNNEYHGNVEIYITGTASLENNKINSVAISIYNAGTIKSQTNLVFSSITTPINTPIKITATLTDDNGNTITPTNNVNLNEFGEMTFENNNWIFDYTPTTIETKVLTGNVESNLENLNIKSGILKAIDNSFIGLTGGAFEYGQNAYITLVTKEEKQGTYDIYINNEKIGTYTTDSTMLKIDLPKMTTGTYTVKAEKIDDRSINSEATVEITITKPTIKINLNDVDYGERIKIDVDLIGIDNIGLTETITINLNGRNYLVNVVNGKGSIEITDIIPAKEHIVTATFSGNPNYKENSVKKSITIRKITTPISITAENTAYGELFTATINLNNDADGLVDIYIDNKKIETLNVNNGRATFQTTELNIGKHEMYAIYNGDNTYKQSRSQTTKFNIESNADITITCQNFYYGTSQYIFIETGHESEITVYLDNEVLGTYTIPAGGKTINLPALNAGTHTILAEYAYNPNQKSIASLEILALDTTLTLTVDTEVYYKSPIDVEVELKGTNNELLEGEVIITIGNNEYIIKLSNGKGSITITDHIKPNAYIMTATFEGNNNYKSSKSQKTISIEPGIVKLNVIAENTVYGDVFTAIVTLEEDATGSMTFYIDNKNVGTYTITNGRVEYTTSDLTVGTHTIYVTYRGNSIYYPLSSFISNFEIEPKGAITILGGSYTYGESLDITVVSDIETNVNVYVNGSLIGTKLTTTTGTSFNLPNLNAGKYLIKAEYANNPSTSTQKTITVNKKSPSITLNAEEAEFGETFRAIINIDNTVTGTIDIYIDNRKVNTKQINNGKVEYETDDLSIGTHAIYATYTGNNNYYPVTTTTTTFAIEAKGTISISGADFNYLENAYVIVQTNKIAEVNVYLDQTKLGTYTITPTGSKINLLSLNVGSYTIKAEYVDKPTINTQTTITINKITPTIILTSNDIKYGETFTAIANINSGATGDVEFYIDDIKVSTIQINNGKATYTTNTLTAGTHTIYAIYTGNINYNATNTETMNFNVDLQATISISGANTNYLEDNYITIQTNKQGQVNIYINNTKLDTYAMNGNSLTIKLPTLNAGAHTIKAEYADNPTINHQTTITINKINPTINITANGTEYGETFTATVNLNSGATGEIEIYIDGEKVETIQINNQKATYTTTSLNEGTHTIYATYTGNNNYNTATTETTSFNIKSQPTITISGANYNYLEDAYITIQTNKEGQVNIYINSTKLDTYTINENTLTIKLPTLNAGTHTIKAEYTNKPEINNQTTITINKITPTLTLTSNNILHGETVTVVLNSPENITGTVKIYLDGKKQGETNIIDGKGQYELDSLDIGTYKIYAEFTGDLNYNSTTSNVDEIIISNISTIAVIGGQYEYGNNAYILINTNKATSITVYLNDTKIGIYNVGTNTHKVDLGKLNVGNYTIKVEYSENSTINDLTTVEIIKTIPTITINTNNITYGADILISGDISSGATGFVEIYLNNNKINKTEIQNGKISYTINKQNSGEYRLYIKYDGDENHEEVTSTTIVFNVTPQKTNLTITTDKFSHLTNGTIYVTVLPNSTTITGEVTLTIDGKQSLEQILKNGTAIFNTNLLTAGPHTLKATYNGDNNHYNSSNNLIVTVEKVSNEMTHEIITDEDGNVKIKVTVPKDDNNNVKFIMNKKVQNVPLDGGIGFVDLSELKEGTYNFKLQYEGDYYNVKDIENTVTIPKKTTTDETFNIATENVVMYYKNESGINAILTNSKGEAISGEKITILINNGEYTRTTNDKGEIFFEIKLNPKNYEATLIYKNVTKTVNITVKPTIVGNNLVKYFQNGSQFQFKILDDTGKPLAKQKVTLNINGVFYTRTTNNNGIATMEINLPVGSYIITLNSTRNSEITSFNVTVLSKLKADNIVKYYQNDTQYKVQLLDDTGKPLSNKQITLNINGVFYTRTTNNDGIATMTINLPVGDYIITVQYGNSVTSNNVSVLSKIKTENLVMSANNRKAFKITSLDNNGKPIGGKAVSFNINGVYYNRITKEDGSASLDINLPSGEYIITTMYDNQLTSNKVTIRD